ncbi:hypothetical protein L9F63_026384, partial [Diploptera punctata]
NTFSPYSPAWTPRFDILPQNVTLPAFVPQDHAHTTFLILNNGQMPLMFKFLPPKIT